MIIFVAKILRETFVVGFRMPGLLLRYDYGQLGRCFTLNTLPDYDIQLTTKPFIAHFKVRMTTKRKCVDF